VKEALAKIDELPSDISWHFIGTLQKNKVNKVINQFSLIHSVDSMDLAQKISDAGESQGITTRVLIQVNTSQEATKHGLSPDNWRRHWPALLSLPALQIEGLMTMAPLTEDESIIHAAFADLRIFKESLEQEFSLSLPHLSMGMSHDFEIAIAEGATLLRIGTALF
jgi:pyridoxal phosphate enzyme (YggS family)